MEEAVRGKHWAFAAAHRSDEDRRAYTSPLPDVLRQSLPRPRMRHGR